MSKAIYDKALKESQEFKILYSRYFNSGTPKYKEAFATFQEFYDWSMTHGFVLGAKLVAKDTRKPFSKRNCVWKIPKDKRPDFYGDVKQETIKRWNKTVNRIRVHYGLVPF